MKDRIAPDLIIWGLTGSGKTTLTNELKKQENSYLLLRAAGTIKQIICELRNWTPEELEEYKRKFPEIREEHHEHSDYLNGSVHSNNRVQLLMQRNHLFFEASPELTERPIIITDGRTYDEMLRVLENNGNVIVLTRKTEEYKNSAHFTEVDIFENGSLIKLINKFPNKIIIIDNGAKDSINKNFVITPDISKNLMGYIFINNATKAELESIAGVYFELIGLNKI